MQYTDVYNLKKPDLNDLPTIRDINENMEVIEEALPSYIKVLYGETVPTSRIPGKYYLISLDETNTNYRVEDSEGNIVHSETNGDLVLTDMGSLNQALADVKQHQITYTSFCVNNGSIDSNGDENLLYTDNSTGVSEVEFIQPVLTSNGTLGGDSFAVGGTSSNTWLAFDDDLNTYLNETTTQLDIDMYNPTPILLKSIGLTTNIALECKATISVRNDGDWQVVGTYPLRSINGGVEQVYSVNDLTEKFKYIRLRLETNSGYEAFLISRIRLGAIISESVTVGSSLLKFRGGITGTSASRKAFTLNSIAPRDVTGLNGDLNVFVSEVGLVEFLGEVYNQRVEPTNVNEFDIWLNNLEPMSAKVRINNTWVNYEGVPVGSISVVNGVIQSVYTNPYNQNGYSVNTYSVATPTTFGVMRTTSFVDEQNCTCSDCAITPSSFYNLSNFRKANWSYSVNDIVGVPYHANLILKCVKAGTTSSNSLNTTGHLYTNQQITDGSVTWQVLDMLTVSANDPNAVHKTGDETIHGVKSFNNLMYIYNNMSNKNSQMDLFTTPANTLYARYMFVDKNDEVAAFMQYGQQNTGTDFIGLFIHDKNRALHGLQVTTNNEVIPFGNNTYNLGSSGLKWADVYSTNAHINFTYTNRVTTDSITHPTDNSYCYMSGGSDWDKGGALFLYGISATNFTPGGFTLVARKTDGSPIELVGNPNGELVWNGKNLTTTEFVKGTNYWYRKHSDGFIEMGGFTNCVDKPSNVVETNLPLAFSNTNYTLLVQMTRGTASGKSWGTDYSLPTTRSKTTTRFEVYSSDIGCPGTNGGYDWYACGY